MSRYSMRLLGAVDAAGRKRLTAALLRRSLHYAYDIDYQRNSTDATRTGADGYTSGSDEDDEEEPEVRVYGVSDLEFVEEVWHDAAAPPGSRPVELRLRNVSQSTALAHEEQKQHMDRSMLPGLSPGVQFRQQASRCEMFTRAPAAVPGATDLDCSVITGTPLLSADTHRATAGSFKFFTQSKEGDKSEEDGRPNDTGELGTEGARQLLQALGYSKRSSFAVRGHEFLRPVAIGIDAALAGLPAQTSASSSASFTTTSTASLQGAVSGAALAGVDTALLCLTITQTFDSNGYAVGPEGYWEVELVASAPIGGDTPARIAAAVLAFAQELSPFVILSKASEA